LGVCSSKDSTSADAGSSTTGTSGSGSTTADAGSSGSGTSSSSDTTGSTTAAGSGSSDTSSSSGGSSSTSSAVMAQLPGFSAVNADQIISTCQSSPDKQLSEILGSGGSTAQ